MHDDFDNSFILLDRNGDTKGRVQKKNVLKITECDEEEFNSSLKLLKEGCLTAYIDKNYSSNLANKPQFVSNNYKEGRKVLSSIEDELLSCKEFFISVAFIAIHGRRYTSSPDVKGVGETPNTWKDSYDRLSEFQ